MQAAGLVAQGLHLLLEHYKIGKLQECKATIVAADWSLVAGEVALEAFGLTLGVLWRSLGGSWEPLCSHWMPLGDFRSWGWLPLVPPGSTLRCLGSSLGSF